MSGLAPDNLPAALGAGDVRPDAGDPIDIDLTPEIDPNSKMLAVTVNDDGSVDIELGNPKAGTEPDTFYGNLAEHLGDSDLSAIAEELLMGIQADDESRAEWLSERAEFIKLLALKLESNTGASTDGAAPVDGQSRIRHPMMLEAVLRFQANASAELLPADGPVKIRDDSTDDTLSQDQEASNLERDMNHYLTAIATEFYPDTDRMLLYTGFGGTGFKKVYRCPLRRRPVSESVDATDLIVSHSATDLGNAQRITHVVRMSQPTMKRMKLIGAYRDVALVQPVSDDKNAVEQRKEEISGVSASNTRPEDEQHTLYECYCLIDVPGHEHKEDGEITGIPLPYKVTIDKTSRVILEIRRNWREDDEMQRPIERFVKYSFVPGFGFWDLGLGHIMGNPTQAATALWRIMLDAGIFANFPGFLYAKGVGKQNSNEFRIPPGGGAPIDVSESNGDIRGAVMPLPYKEPGPAMMSLGENIVETGKSVGMTAEIQVGEGKQDAPVGTTIALLEQATKVMDAVHKRLHNSQKREIELLVDLFREHPEDFWKYNRKPSAQWTAQQFVQALNDRDLVPASDPNTSSHMQRLMRAQALYMMATQHPDLFDVRSVQEYALEQLKIANPQRFMAQQQAAPPPDPKAQASMMSAQADLLDAQNDQAQLAFKMKNLEVDNQNRDQDRAAKVEVAKMGLQKELMIHADKMETERETHASGLVSDHAKQAKDHAHDVGMAGLNAAMQPPVVPPQQGDLS